MLRSPIIIYSASYPTYLPVCALDKSSNPGLSQMPRELTLLAAIMTRLVKSCGLSLARVGS